MIAGADAVCRIIDGHLQYGRVQFVQVHGHRVIALVVVPHRQAARVETQAAVAFLQIVVFGVQQPFKCIL